MTKSIYLDTSALVKRFLEEDGTTLVDSLFDRVYDEEAELVLSQWNLGEAAAVFNKYENRDIIPNAQDSFQLLYNEISLLTKLGSTQIIPVLGKIITDSIPLIFKYHLYIADAIQVETCKSQNCSLFTTFDSRLRDIAKTEGLKVPV